VVLSVDGDAPPGLWRVAIRSPGGAIAVHFFNETDAAVEVALDVEPAVGGEVRAHCPERRASLACPPAALLTVRLVEASSDPGRTEPDLETRP